MALLQQQSLPPLSLATSIPLSSTPNQSRSSTPVPQFSLLRGETLPVGRSSSPLARADPSPGSRQHQQLGNGHPSTPNFSASPTGRPEMLRSATSSTLRNGVAPPPEAPVGPVKTSFGGVGRKRGPSATASPTPSAPSPSPQTSSTSPAATALPLAAARLASLLGALHLLSGRLGDAQQSFLDALLQFSKLPATAAASAAAMAGGAGDPLWHGATLEGLATAAALIECKPKSPSLPAKDGAAAAPSPAHEVISGHLDSALAMYHRASPTYSPTGENPFPTLYTNAALRHARLLLVIRQRGPLTPLSQPFLRLAPAPTDGPCPNPSVAKHVVGQLATHAHGPWLVLLPPSDRLAALRIVVGVFRSVGMRRKEGVFARMVVACLGEMIVLSRISSAAAATPGAADSAVGVRFEDGKEGNDALLELMDRYLVAYGVDVEADGGVFAGRDEREVKEIRAGPKGSAAGEGEAQIGWPELQMRALRDSIGLAEVLPGACPRSPCSSPRHQLTPSAARNRPPFGRVVRAHDAPHAARLYLARRAGAPVDRLWPCARDRPPARRARRGRAPALLGRLGRHEHGAPVVSLPRAKANYGSRPPRLTPARVVPCRVQAACRQRPRPTRL